MWVALVWSLLFPASPKTAVTDLQHPRHTPPSRMQTFCSAVCTPVQQPQGQGTPTCSWGEEHLSPADVCLPQGQRLQVRAPRAAAPWATATGEKPEETHCGKIWISKELQEKMSKWSTVEEIAEKQEMSGGYCNANDPTVLPSACWRSWGEPTTTHRDSKASWGWREERHSSCLQPGADGRKCLAKCLIVYFSPIIQSATKGCVKWQWIK